MFNRKAPPAPVPSDAEIDAVLVQLMARGALSYQRLHATNEGLALELSFNTVSAGTASGTLTVALRAATVCMEGPFGPDARWAEALLDTVKATSDKVERTNGRNDMEGDKQSAKDVGQLGGTVGVPGFSLKPLVRQERGSDSHRQTTFNDQLKITRDMAAMEVQRSDQTFTLELGSTYRDDLCSLNHHLSRIPAIQLDEPSACGPDRVRLDVVAGASRFTGMHTFHIRQATGLWEAANAGPNKRAVVELLMSKLAQTRAAAASPRATDHA